MGRIRGEDRNRPLGTIVPSELAIRGKRPAIRFPRSPFHSLLAS